jgi:outer membrane protein TolC
MNAIFKSMIDFLFSPIPGEPLCLCVLVAKKELPLRHQDTKNHKGIILKFVSCFSKQKKEFLKVFSLISIIFNLLTILPANSQSDSLLKYLEIAAKNNPSVMQKFNEYQAALQKIPQVGSVSDPELSMGVFLSPMELVNGNQVADIRLMQMFPWFGVLKSAKDEMSLMAHAKFELFRDAKLQLFYDVQRTWYDLYRIQKNINISEKNIEILKTIERLAVVSFSSSSQGKIATSSTSAASSGSDAGNNVSSSGMQNMGKANSATSVNSTPSMQSSAMGITSGSSGLIDLYRIQMEEGELENNISLLKNKKNTVIAQFNSYLNRPMTFPVFMPETITPDSPGLSLISVSDSILVNNPMLGMLEYEKQSLDARTRMVTRMGYPMVGLGLNYSLISQNSMSTSAMNGNDMIMPMVTVTLPVYRKKYNAMRSEAELLKKAASLNYQATSNSLQTEYYQAVQLYSDAQSRIKLYNNQYQLASKSLDLMMKSFSVGKSGLTDVLRVRQQTLDYEIKQSEAVADFNTAVAWLKRLGNLEINGNR